MIAGPEDVKGEKNIVREEIHEWNSQHSRQKKIVLLPADWEVDVAPAMGERGQGIINRNLVDKSDLLIAVFWTRIGSPTEKARSGTLEEIERFTEAGKPLMIYFSSAPQKPNSIDRDQYEDLEKFKQECQERGIYKEFQSKEEFRNQFGRDLNSKIDQHDYFHIEGMTSRFELEENSDETIAEGQEELLDASVEGKQEKEERVKEPWIEDQFGVTYDNDVGTKLDIEPSLFFYNRIADAFPGVRGLESIDVPEEAVERLKIFLKEPLQFDSGEGGISEPIWWFRGGSHNGIRSFKKLSEAKCLINRKELNVDRIVVFRHPDKYRNFVYVKVNPEEPTGVYGEYDKNKIQEWKNRRGYFPEEYGLLNGEKITREEYDDASAVIDGNVVDASDAELRERYLTEYNLFIVPHNSPLNSKDLFKNSREYLDGILEGKYCLEDFLEVFLELPKKKF